MIYPQIDVAPCLGTRSCKNLLHISFLLVRSIAFFGVGRPASARRPRSGSPDRKNDAVNPRDKRTKAFAFLSLKSLQLFYASDIVGENVMKWK